MKFEEDLAEVRKALRENPENFWALRKAAEYYLKEEDYRQAQLLYRQAVSLCPRLLPEVLLDYESVIEKNPEKLSPRFSLAWLMLALGERETALLELEEILEIFPQKVEIYNVLGKIYVKQGKIDEAIALLERARKEGVKDLALAEVLAAAYLEKGEMGKAVELYEQIRQQKAADKRILRILGELYFKVEDYRQAAYCFRDMFSEDPEVAQEVVRRLEDLLKKVEGSIEIREILSEVYMKILNPEAAVEKLREIISLEPTKLENIVQKLKNILKNYPHLPSAVLALAEAWLKLGRFSEAAEAYAQLIKIKPEFRNQALMGYQKILSLCPEQVLARTYLAEVLLVEGKIPEALFELGKIVEQDKTTADTIIRKCREILRARPNLLHAHVVLGQAYLAKGDYQRAVLEAESVIALDKNIVPAYLLLGEAYQQLKLLRKASEAIAQALALDPFNFQIQELHREIRQRELEKEIASLQQRIQEDPGKMSLYVDLAKLYLEKGDKQAAIRQLQSAQKDPAHSALVRNLLGNIYRSQGRYDLAATQYQQALEVASAEMIKIIQANLGTAFEAQGEVKKAIKAYEAVLQQDVDFGNLSERITQLKAVGLSNLRSKALLAVISNLEEPREIIALWGREVKPLRRTGQKEEINVSFGQEHNQAGFEFFLKGMFAAAEEEFNLAVQLDPSDAVALNNLAVVLARVGRLEEARLKLLSATELFPASSIFYNNLGIVYFLLGKHALAKTALEKSYALNPYSSAICLNLGDYYFRQKEIARAMELYRKIGDFDPLTELARQRLLFRLP